jgi:hypothetical protein
MGAGASTNINNIVNGSGLSSLSLTASHDPATPTNAWVSDNFALSGNITFNLGALYNLGGFSLWNFNANPGVGIREVNIQSSTDGTTFTTIAGAPTVFAGGLNNAAVPAQQFSFTPVSAAYVRFQVLNNIGNIRNTGLSEVQFDSAPLSTTAVPEPISIFGTLTAIGGGAFLKRQLKRVKSE